MGRPLSRGAPLLPPGSALFSPRPGIAFIFPRVGGGGREGEGAWLLARSSSQTECLLLAPWESGSARYMPSPHLPCSRQGLAQEVKSVANWEARTQLPLTP